MRMMRTALRRTAVVPIHSDDLIQLLNLPAGFRILGIEAGFNPPSILLRVEGDKLSPVPDSEESPVLMGQWTLRTDDHGNRTISATWDLHENAEVSA